MLKAGLKFVGIKSIKINDSYPYVCGDGSFFFLFNLHPANVEYMVSC
jgi:hypothetical protein